MRRALEFEIRLSYHERILKTLPPAMQEQDANVISVMVPSPDFEYEDPCTSIFALWGTITTEQLYHCSQPSS